MVCHGRLAEVREANRHIKGKIDYLTDAFKPDNRNAVKIANLPPNKRVLDLGTGSKYVFAATKTPVKDTPCVGVNAFQKNPFLDVLDTLTSANLAVAQEDTDHIKVYLINENMTKGALAKVIQNGIG